MKNLKRIWFLFIIVITLSSALLLSSCDAYVGGTLENRIEMLLNAKSYTFSMTGDEVGGSILFGYVDNENNIVCAKISDGYDYTQEVYIWYDKNSDSVNRVNVSDFNGEKSIERIEYTKNDFAKEMNELFTVILSDLEVYLYTLDLWKEVDGEYYFEEKSDYTVTKTILKAEDDGFSKTVVETDISSGYDLGEGTKITFSNFDKTKINIPDEIRNAK